MNGPSRLGAAHNRQYLAPKSWNPENPRALNMCRYVRVVKQHMVRGA